MQVLNCEQAGTFLGFSASETSESEFITGEAEDGETVRLHPPPKKGQAATPRYIFEFMGYFWPFWAVWGISRGLEIIGRVWYFFNA